MKPIINSLAAIAVGVFLLVSACDNTPASSTVPVPPPTGKSEPKPINFVVLDAEGNSLITLADFRKIKMYYFDSAGKRVEMDKNCPDRPCNTIKKFQGGSSYLYYYSTIEAPVQSVEKGIKDFYLQIGEDTDTLTLDIEKLAAPNPAGDSYIYHEVSYNGDAYIEDNTVPKAYIFQKYN